MEELREALLCETEPSEALFRETEESDLPVEELRDETPLETELLPEEVLRLCEAVVPRRVVLLSCERLRTEGDADCE